MTTVTLEVPDDLAVKFKIDPSRLPALIRDVLEARLTRPTTTSTSAERSIPVHHEMLEFLTSGPTPEQLLDFKISSSTQQRLEELLDRNREENLTQDERTELETYLQFSHLLTRLKARARSGHAFPA